MSKITALPKILRILMMWQKHWGTRAVLPVSQCPPPPLKTRSRVLFLQKSLKKVRSLAVFMIKIKTGWASKTKTLFPPQTKKWRRKKRKRRRKRRGLRRKKQEKAGQRAPLHLLHPRLLSGWKRRKRTLRTINTITRACCHQGDSLKDRDMKGFRMREEKADGGTRSRRQSREDRQTETSTGDERGTEMGTGGQRGTGTETSTGDEKETEKGTEMAIGSGTETGTETSTGDERETESGTEMGTGGGRETVKEKQPVTERSREDRGKTRKESL